MIIFLVSAMVIFVLGAVNHPGMDWNKEEFEENKKLARITVFVELLVVIALTYLGMAEKYILFMSFGMILCAILLTLGKITGGRKAHQFADLSQAVTCIAQHIFAFLNAAAVQVSNGGNAVLPLEGVGQIVFVQVGKLCQQVQRDILAVVGVQIPLDLGALPVLGRGSLLQLQRNGGAAHQPDQQYLQQVLTNGLAAV